MTQFPGSLTADTQCLILQGNFEGVWPLQWRFRVTVNAAVITTTTKKIVQMCLAVKTFLAERTLDLYRGFLGINVCFLFFYRLSI